MLLFCPTCANVLESEEGPNSCYRFSCSTCPYIYNITKRISSRTYTKLKEVDDVLGGSAAWENVDSIEEGPNSCYRFSCSTCPYIYNITKRISSRTYTKLKEVDDVLGGSAAWDNVDSTEVQCERCDNKRAYF